MKKEIETQVFSYEFCEIFKSTFFTEQLRATASVDYPKSVSLHCNGLFLMPYVKLCGVSDISVMFITYYYICKLQISVSYPIVMKKLERTIKFKLIFWKKKSFIILTKK